MIHSYQEFIREFSSSEIKYRRNSIHEICRNFNITGYTINDDFSIDVLNNVDLSYKGLTEIPLTFRKVTGFFSCFNNDLTSLKGCPKIVVGSFGCQNNKLTSLEGSPERVDFGYVCSNNQLTSLEGCPSNLKSLICDKNKIRTFEGIDKVDSLYCTKNPIYSILSFFGENYNQDQNTWSTNKQGHFLEVVNTYETLFSRPDVLDGDTLEQIAEDLKVKLPPNWIQELEDVGYQVL